VASADWNGVHAQLGVKAFDDLFQAEVGKRTPSYIANVRSVVDLLNERHARDVQVVSVIVASLLGGVVGAAITAVVQLAAQGASGAA
jgi:hypothetical protein